MLDSLNSTTSSPDKPFAHEGNDSLYEKGAGMKKRTVKKWALTFVLSAMLVMGMAPIALAASAADSTDTAALQDADSASTVFLPAATDDDQTQEEENSEYVPWTTIGGCQWSLDHHVLTIKVYSSGELPDGAASENSWPWVKNKNVARSVETVVIEKGVVAGDSLAYLFKGLTSLTEIEGLENLDTSKVTNMSYLFKGCHNLGGVDLSSLDTSNVTTMCGMFEQCLDLTSINVSGFDTSKVTDMSSMFELCRSLETLNISNFDTAKTASFDCMFQDCSALKSVNLSNFVTSQATGMYSMFNECSSLTSLDLSSFDTSKVTSMGFMFAGCTNLKKIVVSEDKWSTASLKHEGGLPVDADVFEGCTNLVGGRGTVYDANHTNAVYARVDYAQDAPGYLTAAPKNIQKCAIESILDQVYTGAPHTPEVKVADGDKTLALGTDFKVAYSDNVNSGTATVTVTGMGDYSGSTKVQFKINPRHIILTSASASKTYDGGALTDANVSVDGDGFAMSDNATYTVTGAQTNVGTSDNTFTYEFSAGTLASNYDVECVMGTLTVTAADIATCNVAAISNQTYNGSALTPEVTITADSTLLVCGADYSVAYSDNVNAGTATVTITGLGNYSGQKTAQFTVNKRYVKLISASAHKSYDGEPLTNHEVDVAGDGFVGGEGATYAFTGSQTDVGASDNSFTYTLSQGTSTANYDIKISAGTLAITAAQISSCTISSIPAQTYTGLALTPAVKVMKDGKTLVVGTDYLVVYENNVAVGTATASIVGIGNYQGMEKKTFQIVKGRTDAKDTDSNAASGSNAARASSGNSALPATGDGQGGAATIAGIIAVIAAIVAALAFRRGRSNE